MKIGITGTSSGIGEALVNVLTDLRPEVDTLVCINKTRLDRRDSYTLDLSNKDDYGTAVELLSTCDIVVNNAYAGDVQARLLYDLMIQYWVDVSVPKKIINITSMASLRNSTHISLKYRMYKGMLDETIRILETRRAEQPLVQVSSVRFGYVDTKLVRDILDKNTQSYLTAKMAALYVYSVIISDHYIHEVCVSA